MPSLFIGRFQPFHLGHLDVIQKALGQDDFLFIAIGSANKNFHPLNPFTAGERFQMIQSALDEVKISRDRYAIVMIPNIENYALWPHHIAMYLPPFERIYTGSSIVRILFENANRNRKNPWQIIDVAKKLKISSTQIRKLMLQNKKWQHLAPKSVAKIMSELNAVKRVKAI